jgi:hypothetical protein
MIVRRRAREEIECLSRGLVRDRWRRAKKL